MSRAATRQKQISRTEYQILVEQAPIMIWRSNTTAQCDYFNDRWLRFRGRGIEQEIGNQWTEGVHPEDLERCLTTYLTAFRNREPFEMQYRLRRSDGIYRWILDSGAPFFGADGGFQGYIGSCTDITERVEAQRVLNEARDRELANLRRLLPICMLCKRIQKADGKWVQLEEYIESSSRAEFTHGLCPACNQFYREQYDFPAKSSR
ncbi:MAG TPA: PAS domain-containing protein [Bryobacteraceae bacterium]